MEIIAADHRLPPEDHSRRARAAGRIVRRPPSGAPRPAPKVRPRPYGAGLTPSAARTQPNHHRLTDHAPQLHHPTGEHTMGHEFVGVDEHTRVPQRAAVRLDHQHQPLGRAVVHGERRRAVRLQGRARALRRDLDVLRVVVAALADDHVLQPAGHEQLVVVQEPEVAGAQPGPHLLLTREAGPEGAQAFFGPPVVTVRHAGAVDPDLADRVLREPGQGLGIGDTDRGRTDGRSAAGDGDAPGPLRRYDPALPQRVGGDRSSVGSRSSQLPVALRVFSASP